VQLKEMKRNKILKSYIILKIDDKMPQKVRKPHPYHIVVDNLSNFHRAT
jgi:hypothetical protein